MGVRVDSFAWCHLTDQGRRTSRKRKAQIKHIFAKTLLRPILRVHQLPQVWQLRPRTPVPRNQWGDVRQGTRYSDFSLFFSPSLAAGLVLSPPLPSLPRPAFSTRRPLEVLQVVQHNIFVSNSRKKCARGSPSLTSYTVWRSLQHPPLSLFTLIFFFFLL